MPNMNIRVYSFLHSFIPYAFIFVIVIIVFAFFVIIFSGWFLLAMSYFNVPTLNEVINKIKK